MKSQRANMRICEYANMRRIIVLAFAFAFALFGVPLAGAQVIDAFENAGAWRAAPASGVNMALASDVGHAGNALKVTFDFHGGGGWAAFRSELPIHLPENYEISFWLKGAAPRNTLELKLIDKSGENVWWVNRPDFEYAGDWRKITFRKRHVTFAWGPAGGGDIQDVAAIEFAVTAGTGGKGTIWIDELKITPREPVRPYDATPVIIIGERLYVVDFTRNREYGGIIVDWNGPGHKRTYDVQISMDGASWQTVRTVRDGLRVRDYLQLPEAESRYLRITLASNERAAAIRNVRVMPTAWGASRNAMFETIAADAPRGAYPKYLRGVQSYWTVVGTNGGSWEALINEEGAVEVDKRSFSIEPFLRARNRLITWQDALVMQSLEESRLPIPSVTWRVENYSLQITAFAEEHALWLRYRVHNQARAARKVTLYLAIRPFQVNPSSQFLNGAGGVALVREIDSTSPVAVRVDSARVIHALTRPAGFGAASFDEGDILDFLGRGALPVSAHLVDPNNAASAALAYPLDLAAGQTKDVYLAVTTRGEKPFLTPNNALAVVTQDWKSILDGFEIRLPGRAARINDALHSNLAYILINRDGSALQPGSRSYERSWIRDGSLTSAALLRLRRPKEVRDFIEWYAPYQYADGKVPCCVDYRGADPVPENDSHGQLIYVIAEYFRFTQDTAFVRRLWPHVERAVAYIDSLRNSRRTPQYVGTPFFGLLPQSISHEGYSAKPMHSYWDDFFALKGLKDATWLARELGDSVASGRTGERASGRSVESEKWALIRDEFQTELMQSLALAMKQHGIDFLPGAAELGDFDATSTTVAVNPAGAMNDLPNGALKRTFDKYWDNFGARRDSAKWEAYTPYEWRTVGTFVRLGERRRAQAALEWFMENERPAAWNQWSEVVYRNREVPHFIGDMPHTWVGSDFIRSVLDMFVYEADEALIIAAGVIPEWLDNAEGISVTGIGTPYGTIGYSMKKQKDTVIVRFDEMPRAPKNGVVVRSPLERALRSASADGLSIDTSTGEIRLPRMPRVLVLSY